MSENRIPGTGLTRTQWNDLERTIYSGVTGTTIIDGVTTNTVVIAPLKERFSKVWLQISGLGTLCVTLFPIVSTRTWRMPSYEIIVARNVRDFSVENISRIISEKLQ